MAKRLALIGLVVAIAAVSAAFSPGKAADFSWQLSPTGSAARLRGLSAVSDYGRVGERQPRNGAAHDERRLARGSGSAHPGTATLQFRDIEAFDARHAVILSIGNGTDSRIYVTRTAARTWTLAFENTEPAAFYDCMTFFDKQARPRALRPGRRPLPHPRDERRRAQLERRGRRHAARAAR